MIHVWLCCFHFVHCDFGEMILQQFDIIFLWSIIFCLSLFWWFCCVFYAIKVGVEVHFWLRLCWYFCCVIGAFSFGHFMDYFMSILCMSCLPYIPNNFSLLPILTVISYYVFNFLYIYMLVHMYLLLYDVNIKSFFYIV